MSRKIASHFALIDGHLERNIIIEIDESRRIISIEQCDALDSRAGVEFYSGIITAGLINAHCHLELSYLHGAIAEGSGFAGFAREIGRVRGNFSDEQRIHAASIADARMWEEGVEAVADIANDTLVMDVKRRSKIKYHTFIEVFGLGCNTTKQHRAMCSEANMSLTPHSTYSVQDAILRELCRSDYAPLSIHFLESEDEIALYDGKGSLAEWYRATDRHCDFLHYGTPSKRIVESVSRDRRMMLVHNCMALEFDVTMMENHFAESPAWVLCPESNRYISRLAPPTDMLRNMGCHVAIGTDSLASARHLSMIENMKLLKGVPLTELMTWATEGGAYALKMERELGSIAVGKCPGLTLFEGVDLHNMQLTTESTSRRLV